eukprot:7391219-Prymnesium_polylepis.1
MALATRIKNAALNASAIAFRRFPFPARSVPVSGTLRGACGATAQLVGAVLEGVFLTRDTLSIRPRRLRVSVARSTRPARCT